MLLSVIPMYDSKTSQNSLETRYSKLIYMRGSIVINLMLRLNITRLNKNIKPPSENDFSSLLIARNTPIR